MSERSASKQRNPYKIKVILCEVDQITTERQFNRVNTLISIAYVIDFDRDPVNGKINAFHRQIATNQGTDKIIIPDH